jgi:hypothetical protein
LRVALVSTYSDDGSDASIELTDRETSLAASVYIYPAAAYRTGADFDAHFADMVSQMVSHFAATVQRTVNLADVRFPNPGRRATATFSRDGQPWTTEAVLFRRGPFYFAARFTFPAHVESQARVTIDRILAESFNPCAAHTDEWTVASLDALLGPSGAPRSATELEAIGRWIRRIERDPNATLASDAASLALEHLLRWVVATHDLRVVIRPWVATLVQSRAELPQLTAGATLGMAAYEIEHRAESPDPSSEPVQLAGVESATRWYDGALRDGAQHVAALDEIVAFRDRHMLSAWLASHDDAPTGNSASHGPPSHTW